MFDDVDGLIQEEAGGRLSRQGRASVVLYRAALFRANTLTDPHSELNNELTVRAKSAWSYI